METKPRHHGLPLDLVADVASAMSVALCNHKAVVRDAGGDPDYWQYVDANHRYLLAAAAISALRGKGWSLPASPCGEGHVCCDDPRRFPEHKRDHLHPDRCTECQHG